MEEPADDRPVVVATVNVKLVDKGRDALDKLVERWGDVHTATNRALQMYSFINDELASGGELAIMKDGKLTKVGISDN